MALDEKSIARFRYRATKELAYSVDAKRAGESPLTEWWAEVLLLVIEENDRLNTKIAQLETEIRKAKEECARQKAMADAMQNSLVGSLGSKG